MPAPTVRPPSRIAKVWPESSAIGLPSATVTCTVSPGSADAEAAEPPPFDVPLGYRHVGVDGVEQVQDRRDPALLARERRQSGDPHDWHLLGGIPVSGQQFADLELD